MKMCTWADAHKTKKKKSNSHNYSNICFNHAIWCPLEAAITQKVLKVQYIVGSVAMFN